MEEFLFTEKYRPHKVADTILPQAVKNIFQSYVDSGTIPNLLLTGSAGTGKTTIARALCEEVGCDFLFINSSEERGIDTLRTKIVGYAATSSFIGTRKVIILDEADYLTNEAQAALRGVMEEFSSNCTFILTCNFKARLIDAIHSRTTTIDFSVSNEDKLKMMVGFTKRIYYILENENIPYEKQAIIKLVEKYFPDNRRILNELQKYATTGKIDAGIVAQIGDVRNMDELVKHLKNKNFSEMRKWVVLNSDIDPARIYRKIYNNLHEYVKPEYIPAVVVILAKYAYQSGFVSDQEINLVASLTEIMMEAEFK